MRLLLERVPQLQRIAVFESVGRLGSFTLAARELGVTQPAVSRHITTLESQLGCELFHRRSNRVELTAEGSQFHASISDAFTTLEGSLAALRDSNERLVIASQSSVAQRWIAPMIEDLRHRMESCEVSVILFDRENELTSIECDVAIRAGFNERSGFRCQKLLPEVVVPVAAPELAKRLGLNHSTPPTELLKGPLLDVDRSGRPWMSWEAWFAGHGVQFSRPSSLIDYGNYSTLLQQAISGEGVVLGWRYLLGDLVDRGLLVEVGVEVHNPAGGHFLTWPTALHRDQRLRILRDWFDDILPPERFIAHG